MSEELAHAVLIGLHFKIHVHLKILEIRILVRAFEHHAQVVDRAGVALAHIDHDARVFPLAQNHVPVLVFGLEDESRLRDQQLLVVDVIVDLDLGVRRCRCNGVLD